MTGKRVLVIIPDGTRSAPIPLFFRYFHDEPWGRVAALDYLVAIIPVIAVKRGVQGAMARRGAGQAAHSAYQVAVVDTTGAGDAFFAITAPCVAKKFPPELVGFIGNAVGALAVTIVGNRESVGFVQLLKFITTLLK